MSKGNSIPLRRDTQDTLVDSPAFSAGKEQGRSPGSPTKKPTMFSQSNWKATAGRDSLRRSSTGATLVEVSSENVVLDKLGSLVLLKSDETFVTSPTSAVALSAIHSPQAPGSLAPALSSSGTSSISVLSSPESEEAQKQHQADAGKHRDSEGEKFESLRDAACFAARAALNLAEASNVPYLKGIAGVASLILEYADGVAANKEECTRIIDTVLQLLVTLEATTQGLNGVASKALEEQASRLTKILEQVLLDVKKVSDRKRSYFKKFIKMERDKEIIKRCDAKLKDALYLFQLQSSIEMRLTLVDFQIQTYRHFREIVHRRDQRTTLVDVRRLEHSEDATHRALELPPLARSVGQRGVEKLARRLRALPPSPESFHGRTELLERLVVSVLNATASRIAILGPGGIGKSSLALKLLHHQDISSRYEERRFFIPCDSATSVEALMSAVATHLGLSDQEAKDNDRPGQREAEIVSYLTAKTSGSDPTASPWPIIMVLDNFESPWEPDGINVEKFLARLASLDNVTIIITLRGAERPSNVKWSHPLLPPLQILGHQAAREMFLSISGAPYELTYRRDSVDVLDELLTLCGYLPLAIRLMAELAVPGIDTVLGLVERWKRAGRSTAMLSTGEDPAHSLEVSIELSLGSLRIKRVPNAIPLLGLLAMLPDGIQEADLKIAVPQLEGLEECCLTLLRTTLAYTDNVSGRLKVLAPIRAYVAGSGKYKVPLRFASSLERHYWRFMVRPTEGQWDETNIRRALPESGNIESLVDRALREHFDPSSAIEAAINLGQFYMRTSLGKPLLEQLQKALDLAKQIGNASLEADCIYTMALIKHRYLITSNDSVRHDGNLCRDGFLEALGLYEKTNNKAGQGHCLHQLATFYHTVRKFEDSRDSAERALQTHVEAGCLGGQSSALIYLARVLHIMNKPDEAVERAHESLKLLRTRFHDPIQEAQCLQFLGYVQCTTFCNYADARELLEESSRIYKALLLEDSSNCMETTLTLGELDFICSRYEQAKDAFQKAASIYRKTHRPDWEAYSRIHLAKAHLGLNSSTEALDQIHAGLATWEEISNKWGIGIGYAALGDVAMYEGSFSQAEAHYQKALGCFRNDSGHWKTYQAECLLKLGILFKCRDQDAVARESLQESLRLYEQTACRRGRANCNRQLAELGLKDSGDECAKREALAQLENVVREYEEMGLHVERQQCARIMFDTYRLLGEKPPKNLQLQIKT